MIMLFMIFAGDSEYYTGKCFLMLPVHICLNFSTLLNAQSSHISFTAYAAQTSCVFAG